MLLSMFTNEYLFQVIFLTAAMIIFNGLVTIMSEIWSSLVGQLVFALGFGFTQGAYFSSQLVVLRSLNKTGSTSLGLVLGARGLASLCGPLAAGLARDGSGSYSPGFVGGALCALLAALFVLPLERERLGNVGQERSDLEGIGDAGNHHREKRTLDLEKNVSQKKRWL